MRGGYSTSNGGLREDMCEEYGGLIIPDRGPYSEVNGVWEARNWGVIA